MEHKITNKNKIAELQRVLKAKEEEFNSIPERKPIHLLFGTELEAELQMQASIDELINQINSTKAEIKRQLTLQL